MLEKTTRWEVLLENKGRKTEAFLIGVAKYVATTQHEMEI